MLPYSPEILFAIYAQFNQAVWPAQLIFNALLLGLIFLIAKRSGSATAARIVNGFLALAWAWTGIGFHLAHFAPFNFAAPYYGALFLVQAALFAVAALKASPRYRLARGLPGVIGVGLLGYGLFGYPLVDAALGQTWQSLRYFPMAPGATLLVSLGGLLLATGRVTYLLFAVPVLWSLIAGVLAWWLGLVQDAVLPVAGLMCLALFAWRRDR
ncbi:hypothetical protein DFO67_104117 [Modicisalibacter xianhensis]|uniref:Uncharacterized protein n=1 Tax=Modicisalibacter xianhensis TaxID=442341 RepID=A0A4R8FVK1_9GAMM|nr:DUF6064 family protein [Halomonas xianhensis]TDX30858.1 hypothetical protein DFO67_104117 [Halomonas xianhensis]